MKKRTTIERAQPIQLARRIAKMVAQTESAVQEFKADLETRVKDCQARQERALNGLSDLRKATHRALKESGFIRQPNRVFPRLKETFNLFNFITRFCTSGSI